MVPLGMVVPKIVKARINVLKMAMNTTGKINHLYDLLLKGDLIVILIFNRVST